MLVPHLYIHVPFCRSCCAYCDFASEEIDESAKAGGMRAYVAALRGELARRAGVRLGARRPWTGSDGAPLETIYLGGGTPTLLPEDVLTPFAEDLAALLREGGEFTIEANPGTIDAGLLRRLEAAGVTRLSLGIQTFSPRGLAALGRSVSEEEIASALEAISEVDWQDWNLDVVFGIPGMSWGDTKADLEKAITASPAHISLYDLTYSSAYDRWVEGELGSGARRAASEMAEQQYAEAVEHLEAAGYVRYEVSNFALEGRRCRHNQAYWRGEDYLGVGASAVSTQGSKRLTNPERVAEYMAGRSPRVESLSPETRLWEKAMLGLRTRDGVDEAAITPVVDEAARDRLMAEGCLERRYGRLRLNAGYLDVSNSVIATLLTGPAEI